MADKIIVDFNEIKEFFEKLKKDAEEKKKLKASETNKVGSEPQIHSHSKIIILKDAATKEFIAMIRGDKGFYSTCAYNLNNLTRLIKEFYPNSYPNNEIMRGNIVCVKKENALTSEEEEIITNFLVT